jgi:hypothetical protein
VVKAALPVLAALALALGLGLGLARLATVPAVLKTFDLAPERLLYDGSTDQVLRLLSSGLRLSDEVVLGAPMAQWPDGERVTLLQVLVTQDNDALLRLGLALQPEIPKPDLADAICTAARKGFGSVLPVLLERWRGAATDVACADGRAPSALAAEAGHDGAARLLRRRGL